MAWRRASWPNLRKQLLFPFGAGFVTQTFLTFTLGLRESFYPITTWSLATFVVAAIFQEYFRATSGRMKNGETLTTALRVLFRKNQRRYGGYIVHLGIVSMLIGFSGSAFNQETLENVKPGQTIKIADYELKYLTARPIPEQHYGGAVARLALYEEGIPRAIMAPEKRMYWLEQQPASIPSVYSTMAEDLYVILTSIESNGSATLKVYLNPLVNWIWLGGIIFVLGALTILWPHPSREGITVEQ